LLTCLVAQQLGLEPGEFVWTGGDVHIYDNHVEQVSEQLSREPYEYPQLKILRKPASIFDYTLDDFEVVGYRHHPTIKAPIAV
jgi:thymidylate synthase